MEGTVKWFNKNKGFGFIQGEDGKDYFIHHTALGQGSFIREGDKVSFEPVETEKGIQAQNVALLQKGSEIKEGKEEKKEEVKEEKEEGKEEKKEGKKRGRKKKEEKKEEVKEEKEEQEELEEETEEKEEEQEEE